MGICYWALCACAILARLPILAQVANRLSLHACYLVCTNSFRYLIGWCLTTPIQLLHWVALCRHQLFDLLLFFHRVVLSVVAQDPISEMVRQIQLYSCSCARRRHTGKCGFCHSMQSHQHIYQVMVFILSFAVQGASGDSHLFPQW